MFWSGEISDGWIGALAAVVVALVGAWANTGRIQFSGPIHLLMGLIYVPLCIVVINYLPERWFSNALSVKIMVIILTIAISVGAHRGILLVCSRMNKQNKNETRTEAGEMLPSVTSNTYNTVEKYKTAINEAEGNAEELLYIQHRIAPYFKRNTAIEFIASARFGAGSADYKNYVEEHLGRRQEFYKFLANGGAYREIFPRKQLLKYVSSGTHADNKWPLPADEIVALLTGWRETLLRYPNFKSAISDDSIPIKYHIIDRNLVILHEPVGKGDVYRLNSVFINCEKTNRNFRDDFEIIWSLTDEKWRDAAFLSDWIEAELIPMAGQRAVRRRAKA